MTMDMREELNGGDEYDDIEVTPEMIEAGRAILCDEPSVFAGPFGADCDVGDLVKQVFLTMVRHYRLGGGQLKSRNRNI